jgi:hypothetical protein
MDVYVAACCAKGVGLHEGGDHLYNVPQIERLSGQILHEHGFPVPKPIDQARHCIVMEYMNAYPLYAHLGLSSMMLIDLVGGKSQRLSRQVAYIRI